MELFFEGMQSYLSTIFLLIIFVLVLSFDRIISRDIKMLFIIVAGINALIVAATWLDRTISTNINLWRLRQITTFINFAISPLAPLIIGKIYQKNNNVSGKYLYFYYIPFIINVILCLISLKTGWVFNVNSLNEYQRGPIFVVSFVTSGFYLLYIVINTIFKSKSLNKKFESTFLMIIVAVIAISSVLEVAFVKRFMIWSTIAVTIILYYIILVNQKVLFDQLTGTYGKLVLNHRLSRIQKSKNYILTMIDLNSLKLINDSFGHNFGDMALIDATNVILSSRSKNMNMYRYAGDEFILLTKNSTVEEVNSFLNKVNKDLTEIMGIKNSFAYGSVEYNLYDKKEDAIANADKLMYEMKNQMKNQ